MSEPSVKDVAALARVSVGTVSNVLNRPHMVAPETERRVRQAIARLGFVRNDAARQLRVGQSRTVGLIIPDTGNPFFSDLARGAQRRANESGFSVLIGNADHNERLENEYFELFQEQRVRGILVSPMSDSLERVDELRRSGVRVVLVDRDGSAVGIPSVAVDDVAGGAMAAMHLIDGGRRRIVYAGGNAGIRQVRDRRSGVQATIAAATASLHVLDSAELDVRSGLALGQRIASENRIRRTEAVVAANDLVSIGILQALTEAGVRVPDDIAVIGYDDIAFAQTATIPLSSIRQPSELMGATSVDLLSDDDETSGTPPVVFAPELVARASTAAS